MELLPTYSFSMALGIVAGTAAPFFDIDIETWVPSRDYTWEMFYEPSRMTIKISRDHLDIPAPAYFMYRMWHSIVAGLFVFWYLDHLVASNRGANLKWYFPF